MGHSPACACGLGFSAPYFYSRCICMWRITLKQKGKIVQKHIYSNQKNTRMLVGLLNGHIQRRLSDHPCWDLASCPKHSWACYYLTDSYWTGCLTIFQNIPKIFALCKLWAIYFISAIFWAKNSPKFALMK